MKRTLFPFGVLSGLVALVLVVSACGGGSADGGDDDTTGTTGVDANDAASTTIPDTTGAAAETTTTLVGRDDLATTTTKPTVPVTPAIPEGSETPSVEVTVPEGVDPYTVDVVSSAIDDLATLLQVDQMAIGVVGWDEVMWSDGSIGCPQPGMSYTQAVVDGMLIILTHDDRFFEYHQAAGRDPFLCEQPAGTPGAKG